MSSKEISEKGKLFALLAIQLQKGNITEELFREAFRIFCSQEVLDIDYVGIYHKLLEDFDPELLRQEMDFIRTKINLVDQQN